MNKKNERILYYCEFVLVFVTVARHSLPLTLN